MAGETGQQDRSNQILGQHWSEMAAQRTSTSTIRNNAEHAEAKRKNIPTASRTHISLNQPPTRPMGEITQ
jgi:hypothetical protein